MPKKKKKISNPTLGPLKSKRFGDTNPKKENRRGLEGISSKDFGSKKSIKTRYKGGKRRS